MKKCNKTLLNNQISERHARSLLVLSNQKIKKVVTKITAERLTLRQLDDALKSQMSDVIRQIMKMMIQTFH